MPAYLLMHYLAGCQAQQAFRGRIVCPVLPLVWSLEKLWVAPDCLLVRLLAEVQQAVQGGVAQVGVAGPAGVGGEGGAAAAAAADARCLPADTTHVTCIALFQIGSGYLARHFTYHHKA